MTPALPTPLAPAPDAVQEVEGIPLQAAEELAAVADLLARKMPGVPLVTVVDETTTVVL